MSENATNTTIPTPAPASDDTPAVPDKTKQNGKARRARPRRRGAQSDESDDERGGESDGSLTEASSVSEDEEESDEEAGQPTAAESNDLPESGKSTLAPVFADTTPTAWADQPADNPVEDVTFEEFSGRGRGRGRGRGGVRGGGVLGERRELSEEAQKKLAEKRERKKERFKEKRKEKKAAAKLDKESGPKAIDTTEAGPKAELPSTAGPSAPSTKKGKKAPASVKSPQFENTPDIADQTASLSIEDKTPSADPAAPTGPRRPNPREAYQQKIAADPKFTPRVGGFWTHDQRHYNSGEIGNGYAGLRGMSGYWRGQHQHANFRGDQRGFRGRGRGRGGFGPGGMFGHGQGQGPVELDVKEEKRDGRLEMDKLEEEDRLRAERLRAERERREAEVKAAEKQAEAVKVEEPGDLDHPVVVEPKQQRAGNKWGHEGFEQQVELEKYIAFRGGFRGGRGRARGFGGRGGFFAPGPRGFPPAQYPQNPTQPNGSAPQPTIAPAAETAASAPQEPTPGQANPAGGPAEEQSTQSAVDDLLADTSSVTVHLPGSNESVNVPRVTAQKSPTAATPASAQVAPPAVETVLSPSTQTQPAPAVLDQYQPPLPGPSPLPMHLTGGSHRSHHAPSTPFAHSENGSISSSNYIPPPTFLPPGIGITPNGEYFNLANGAPVDFHPTAQTSMGEMMSPAGMGNGRPFFPVHPRQSSGYQFSPGGQASPQPQMFYPGVPTPPIMGMNGFDPSARSDSPFGVNPYMSNQQMGYFIPPAPTKRVSIRPPTESDQDRSESPLPISAPGIKSGKSRLSMNGNTFVPQYQQQQQQQQQYFAQPYNPYTVMQGQMEGVEYGYQGWQGDQGQVGGYQEGYTYQEGYGY